MRNPDSARLRADWVVRARGDVLEIGIGSGLNLPFYSDDVQHVYGVDPSRELQQMARKQSIAPSIRLEFLLQPADEALPLADASIDTAVVTWSLCSIADVSKALQHARRVLKPAGRLIFVEHGRAPEPEVVVWQERLTPVWKYVGGGCHLNRKIDELIRCAGFQITELKTGYLRGPRPMSYTYEGVAEKSEGSAPA